jgi:hypothetical protein
MNVANILPGDDVQVELHYTELVVPTEGRYEFVFPTVVGPRYHKPSTAGGSSSFPASAPEGRRGAALQLRDDGALRLAAAGGRGPLALARHRGGRRRHAAAEVTVNDTTPTTATSSCTTAWPASARPPA